MSRTLISLTNRQLLALNNVLDEMEILCASNTTEVHENLGKCISFPDVISHEVNLVKKALEENLNEAEEKYWHFKLK